MIPYLTIGWLIGSVIAWSVIAVYKRLKGGSGGRKEK
jgi:hypothetical protein